MARVSSPIGYSWRWIDGCEKEVGKEEVGEEEGRQEEDRKEVCWEEEVRKEIYWKKEEGSEEGGGEARWKKEAEEGVFSPGGPQRLAYGFDPSERNRVRGAALVTLNGSCSRMPGRAASALGASQLQRRSTCAFDAYTAPGSMIPGHSCSRAHALPAASSAAIALPVPK